MNKTRQKGFTLIEVLVGFTILALAVAALVSVLGTSLTAGNKAQDQAEAIALAENALAAFDTYGPGATAMRFGTEYLEARLVVKPAEEAPRGGMRLMEVTALVLRDDQMVYRLQTLRVTPEGADGF